MLLIKDIVLFHAEVLIFVYYWLLNYNQTA